MSKTLSEYLKDWTDTDLALFYVGVVLGFWDDSDESFRENKWIFYTDNTLGNMLYKTLDELAKGKFINKKDHYYWKAENVDKYRKINENDMN